MAIFDNKVMPGPGGARGPGTKRHEEAHSCMHA